MSTSCDKKMKDGVCENKSINTSSAIDAASDGINTMNISNNNSPICAADSISVCANCEKEGANNICNKCKKVKYCNAICKKVHKKRHKKDCKEHQRRAAELHDIELFKQPPPAEDCPICFLLLPTLETGSRYYACCGKVICSGCFYAPVNDDQGNEVDDEKCPFCRTPPPNTNGEGIERDKKRIEANDPIAIYNLGCFYRDGLDGYPQDYTEALELFHRAGELGLADAYLNIGYTYEHGQGVEVDKKKANHYYELAAMGGDSIARYNLGRLEENAGNMERALKHHMIAVEGGNNDSLKEIQELYSNGHATKDEYAKALQLYQVYLGEIKSDQRDKAAAYDNKEYHYY